MVCLFYYLSCGLDFGSSCLLILHQIRRIPSCGGYLCCYPAQLWTWKDCTHIRETGGSMAWKERLQVFANQGEPSLNHGSSLNMWTNQIDARFNIMTVQSWDSHSFLWFSEQRKSMYMMLWLSNRWIQTKQVLTKQISKLFSVYFFSNRK